MDNEFMKKTLLVTGATSGIGKATALRFAQAGASIAAVGRNEEALSQLEKELNSWGAQCLTIRADLSREEEARHAPDQPAVAVRTHAKSSAVISCEARQHRQCL